MAAIRKENPAGSIHNSLGWQGQLARVSRWLDRLMCVRSPDDAEDFLYAFFQDCYHLRDWVRTELSSVDVDSFVTGSLRRIQPPTAQEADDRQLTALRARLTKKRTAVLNGIHKILRKHNLEQACPTKKFQTQKAAAGWPGWSCPRWTGWR